MEWDPESKTWRPRWGELPRCAAAACMRALPAAACMRALPAAQLIVACVVGYKGMNNDPNKEWVMEAKDGEQFEEGSDPFLAKSRAKKEAIQVHCCALASAPPPPPPPPRT
jgi:hypothetical protein